MSEPQSVQVLTLGAGRAAAVDRFLARVTRLTPAEWGRLDAIGERNLSGDPIDAWEAHRVGLATQVVPDHELFDTTLAWANKLAEKAPIAVEEIKTRSARADLDEGLASEAEGFVRAFGSDDAKEGFGAFLGKRRPQFRGR